MTKNIIMEIQKKLPLEIEYMIYDYMQRPSDHINDMKKYFEELRDGEIEDFYNMNDVEEYKEWLSELLQLPSHERWVIKMKKQYGNIQNYMKHQSRRNELVKELNKIFVNCELQDRLEIGEIGLDYNIYYKKFIQDVKQEAMLNYIVF